MMQEQRFGQTRSGTAHAARAPRIKQRGAALLALLILIAIIGIAAAAQVQVGSLVERREKEEDLLWIGREFRRALISYSSVTPAGRQVLPATLNELVLDERFNPPRRHLRKIYIDPLTGKEEWGLVRAPGRSNAGSNAGGNAGGIAGVHSLSNDTPIKIGNFDLSEKDFEGKTRYADWQFVVASAAVPPAAAATAGARVR